MGEPSVDERIAEAVADGIIMEPCRPGPHDRPCGRRAKCASDEPGGGKCDCGVCLCGCDFLNPNDIEMGRIGRLICTRQARSLALNNRIERRTDPIWTLNGAPVKFGP